MRIRLPIDTKLYAVVPVFLALTIGLPATKADVTAVSESGFQIAQQVTADASPDEVYEALISNFGQWWSSDHSFSGDATNMKIDLDRRELIESLPDGGFARHMQVGHHQPGNRLTLLGGLGPLQEMGASGALTFRLREHEGKTLVIVTYNVNGYQKGGFDGIAPAVDRVLQEQLVSLAQFVGDQ